MSRASRNTWPVRPATAGRPLTASLTALLAALLTTVLLVALTPAASGAGGSVTGPAAGSSTAADPDLEQWRSYWVDGFHEGIYDQAEVDKLVAEAKDLNANALVVQVGRRFDCFCNRALYPRTDAAIDPAPYDPLDAVIEAAHAEGIEVHAWINATTMWNSSTPPSSPEHAFNQHGPSATGDDRWLNKRYDGAELIGANAFLDPANPAAVDYVVAGVRSIVKEYDVDGVNLDYIRYPDYNSAIGQNDWGYSDVSLARFHAATGRTDRPEPTDDQFSDWRRDQVSNLVRKVYLGMWQVDREARLSINGITYAYGPQTMGGWEQTRPYAEVLQDWKAWLDEGIIDTNTAMNYKREWMPDQAQMYEEWNEVLADWQEDRQSVIGPALYLNDIDDSVQQVRDALATTEAGNAAVGWSGYSYASPSLAGTGSGTATADAERAELEAALTEGPDAPFAEEAAVPAMPWKEQPELGHLVADATLTDGTPLDQVEVSVVRLGGSGEPGSRLTDGSGWAGFVDLEPGRYRVRVERPDGVGGRPVDIVEVRAGQVTEATFGLHRG